MAKVGAMTERAQPAKVSRSMMDMVEANDSALAAMACVRVMMAQTDMIMGMARRR